MLQLHPRARRSAGLVRSIGPALHSLAPTHAPNCLALHSSHACIDAEHAASLRWSRALSGRVAGVHLVLLLAPVGCLCSGVAASLASLPPLSSWVKAAAAAAPASVAARPLQLRVRASLRVCVGGGGCRNGMLCAISTLHAGGCFPRCVRMHALGWLPLCAAAAPALTHTTHSRAHSRTRAVCPCTPLAPGPANARPNAAASLHACMHARARRSGPAGRHQHARVRAAPPPSSCLGASPINQRLFVISGRPILAPRAVAYGPQ